MHTHNEVKNVLDALQKVLAIINLNVELVFDCIVYQYASSNIKFITLIVPMGFECNWDAIPSVWIDVAKTFTAYFNDSLGQHMRFLVKMDMMLIWVIEASDWHLNK